MTGEKLLARLAHVLPASDHALRRGQSLEDERAIPLRDDAPIQEDYGADVRFAADQPAEALFQLERRVRYEIMAEAVQPLRFEALEPRGGEGLARHLEGQLREDQHPQRAARHVHALPKGIGAEQDRGARVAEAAQQQVALALALHQERPAAADLAAHRGGGAAERPVAREQDEHAAVRRVGELEQHACHRGVVPFLVVAWLGQVGRDREQALRREVERRRQDLPHHDARRRQVEPQPLLEIAELATGRERGARQDHRLDAVEQVLLEQRREVERHRRGRDVGDLLAAPLEPAHRRRRARRRAERRRETRRRGVEPPHHAPQLADELRPPLARVVERQAVGDGLHAVPQAPERDQQVVERDAQALGPDDVARELVAQAQHARRSLLAVEPAAEVREYFLGRAARRVQGVPQALLDQVAARGAEQVVPPPQQDRERGQEAAPAALESRQQPVHAHHAHLRAQVGRRHVLEVVRLIEHQSPVGRQHRGFLPIVGRHPHGEVRREQVMVHDHHVRLGCAAARLEHEAALEVRALEAGAQVRFRRHGVPHLRPRLVGEVGEAAVARPRGPRAERHQLRRLPLVEQRLQARARLLEARQAEVVVPALE